MKSIRWRRVLVAYAVGAAMLGGLYIGAQAYVSHSQPAKPTVRTPRASQDPGIPKD